jgi:hypothetical protein
MLTRWIIQLAISFIIRQIAKFGKTIDWSQVKADLALRVEDLVPGKWLDPEAVALCNALVDAAASVLASTVEIEKVLTLLASEKWAEAAQAIKDLILGSWQPSSASDKKFVAELGCIDMKYAA